MRESGAQLDIENLPGLPKGWVWAHASEVCSSVRDGTHDTPKYVDDGIPLITSKNLRENALDFTTAKNISIEDHEKISIRSGVEEGDVLFAMIGTVGNPVVVRTGRILSIKNVGLFKKNEAFLSPEYMKFWLASYPFNEILEKKQLLKGTTQRFIPLEHLRILPIPVAPFPEQHRIVARIEELFTKLDAGVEALNKIRAQLRRYRQAVLKYAFEGKLTEKWREGHKHELEPASVLLERIKQERQKTAKGKYKELLPPDNSNLPELPESWVWVCVGIAVEKIPLTGKKLKQSEYQETGLLPVVDQGQAFIGGYTDRRELRAPCVPPVVIFGDHTKVIKYVNFDFVAGADGVKAMKPLNMFYPKLFYYFLQAIELPEKGYARHFQFLERSFVPVPPFPEQHKIVEKIEERLSVADEIDKAVDRSLKQAGRVRQSILKRAFEGKLVPQDPNDEPAEKLLERIREQRANQIAEKRVAISKVKQKQSTDGN